MTVRRDYIPTKDAEIAAWSENFTNIVLANAGSWEISPQETTDLQTATTNFKNMHDLADSPVRNKIIVKEKNDAKKILKDRIRHLVNFRLRNPIITDAQRISMGLHVRDTAPSPIPVPSSRPEMNIDVLDFRRLSVSFHDFGSASKAKPYGVNGAVILYSVLNSPPQGLDDLTHTVLATRTPYIFEFNDKDRGKTVYFAICWQNEKGERGPMSEISHAIIP
ncbi:MAG: hypothetical protein LBC74_02000 [Planctomycetaceae bacterium]|jgi:hypothetical protein|nr:hypothetical protein [Planctomycetaceae bacterium]